MKWLVPILGAVITTLAGGISVPQSARAQCSVLSRHPCLPYPYYVCGIHSRPGCVPEPILPLNEVPVLRVQGHTGPSEPLDRDHPADRINEMGRLLSQCLELPPQDETRNGMRVTLKLAFKRDGSLLAPPRFTYVTHNAPMDVKQAYREAALAMLDRCAPLPITEELGKAIAGRPFVIPIIETRREDLPDKTVVPGTSGDPVGNKLIENADEPHP
jgi:hypothetical protein